MQIVIEIPKELKQKIDEGFTNQVIINKLWDATRNGTILLKHGDLVDRNEIEVEEDVYNQTYIIHAPTILEATGVEE